MWSWSSSRASLSVASCSVAATSSRYIFVAQGLVEGEYAQGSASLIDYLDARRSRLLTESEFLQTLGSFWVAVFQLEQAVGASYLP